MLAFLIKVADTGKYGTELKKKIKFYIKYLYTIFTKKKYFKYTFTSYHIVFLF